MIKKRGSKFVLISKTTGRVLGTHTTRLKALQQEKAIQANKRKK